LGVSVRAMIKGRTVSPVRVSKGISADRLIREFEKSGVMGAGRIARATNILEKAIRDKCTLFMGFAGAMVPGGMKQVVIDMLRAGWVDVLVSTGANLTHDLVEALGFHHYQGSPDIDDRLLNKKRIDRIYDSFMPDDVYPALEDFTQRVFPTMPEQMNIREFLWELGKAMPRKLPSILRTCYEHKIPLFCPAISDSGIGLQVWNYIQQHKLEVSAFDDLKEILDIAWTSKKACVLYIGGGVPKNYIQQAMQLSPKAASYGVQITMDRPEPGGSSGAVLREGISWGKMNSNAEFVDVICDATIALPLIVAGLKSRLG